MLFGEFKSLCEAGRYDLVYRACEDHPTWLHWAEKKFPDLDYQGYLGYLQELEEARQENRRAALSSMARPLRTRKDYTSVGRKTFIFEIE